MMRTGSGSVNAIRYASNLADKLSLELEKFRETGIPERRARLAVTEECH